PALWLGRSPASDPLRDADGRVSGTPGTLCPQTADPAGDPDRRLDQPAADSTRGGGRHAIAKSPLNCPASCLIKVDRFRLGLSSPDATLAIPEGARPWPPPHRSISVR